MQKSSKEDSLNFRQHTRLSPHYNYTMITVNIRLTFALIKIPVHRFLKYTKNTSISASRSGTVIYSDMCVNWRDVFSHTPRAQTQHSLVNTLHTRVGWSRGCCARGGCNLFAALERLGSRAGVIHTPLHWIDWRGASTAQPRDRLFRNHAAGFLADILLHGNCFEKVRVH